MSTSPPSQAKLAVGEKAFIGLLWGGVAVSFCFVAFRGYVRLSLFRRLFADDVLVLASWLMLLANAIVWEVAAGSMYTLVTVENGVVPPPSDFDYQLTLFFHSQIAINLLNTCGIWAVKLSFMLFFRKLGHNVRGQKWLWWCVLVLIVAAFAICIGVYDWPCLIESLPDIISYCPTPAAQAYSSLSLRIITGCDIITDALILTIPINLLWKVQISNRYKLALVALFSLTIFDMAVAIIRVVVAIGSVGGVDSSWLYTWGAIEQATAIVIACLVSYKALFSKDSYPRQRYTGGTSLHPLRYNRSNSVTKGSTMHDITVEGGKNSSSSLGAEVVPLDTIHVRSEYTVGSDRDSVPRTTYV